jgi:hypothetical protein
MYQSHCSCAGASRFLSMVFFAKFMTQQQSLEKIVVTLSLHKNPQWLNGPRGGYFQIKGLPTDKAAWSPSPLHLTKKKQKTVQTVGHAIINKIVYHILPQTDPSLAKGNQAVLVPVQNCNTPL